jgi:hypothetical protein
MFPQHRIDLSLIPRTLSLEPVHHIRIQPQRQLLFDGFVEHAALGVFPVKLFGRVGEVDILIFDIRNLGQHFPLLRGRWVRRHLALRLCFPEATFKGRGET